MKILNVKLRLSEVLIRRDHRQKEKMETSERRERLCVLLTILSHIPGNGWKKHHSPSAKRKDKKKSGHTKCSWLNEAKIWEGH